MKRYTVVDVDLENLMYRAKSAVCKSNSNQQPTGFLPLLSTSPDSSRSCSSSSSSINFKAHENILVVSTSIVQQLCIVHLAPVQGQIAEYIINKSDCKTHVKARSSQDWNNMSSG